MSHRTIVYPNGMVEVEFDTDPFVCGEPELGCCGIEDTEEQTEPCEAVDPVSDALDVLDAHFANDRFVKRFVDEVRQCHNDNVWERTARHERD